MALEMQIPQSSMSSRASQRGAAGDKRASLRDAVAGDDLEYWSPRASEFEICDDS